MTDNTAPGLRAHLRAGGTAELFWFAIGSPAMVEISLEARPQAVVIDAQHGLWSRQSLEQALGVLDGRAPALVRTADLSETAISAALDGGAIGVFGPLVETADQAQAFVDASRYPPEGRRSGGGIRPLKADFARYYAEAREQTVVGVMIETATGLANVEAIAATPGLDFIFIGTGDLALSMGEFPVPGPAYETAIQHILKTCLAAGLPCGLFTNGVEDARRRQAQGFALTVSANDISLVAQSFAAAAPQPA